MHIIVVSVVCSSSSLCLCRIYCNMSSSSCLQSILALLLRCHRKFHLVSFSIASIFFSIRTRCITSRSQSEKKSSLGRVGLGCVGGLWVVRCWRACCFFPVFVFLGGWFGAAENYCLCLGAVALVASRKGR